MQDNEVKLLLMCPDCNIQIIDFSLRSDTSGKIIKCKCDCMQDMSSELNLTDYLFTIKALHQQTKLCSKKHHPPTYTQMYCLICNEWLCQYCYNNPQIHNQSHSFSSQEVRGSCNVHKAIFQKYCITCQFSLCESCMEEHQTHKIDDIDNYSFGDLKQAILGHDEVNSLTAIQIFSYLEALKSQTKNDPVHEMVINQFLTNFFQIDEEIICLANMIVNTDELLQNLPNYHLAKLSKRIKINQPNALDITFLENFQRNQYLIEKYLRHSLLFKTKEKRPKNIIYEDNMEIDNQENQIIPDNPMNIENQNCNIMNSKIVYPIVPSHRKRKIHNHHKKKNHRLSSHINSLNTNFLYILSSITTCHNNLKPNSLNEEFIKFCSMSQKQPFTEIKLVNYIITLNDYSSKLFLNDINQCKEMLEEFIVIIASDSDIYSFKQYKNINLTDSKILLQDYNYQINPKDLNYMFDCLMFVSHLNNNNERELIIQKSYGLDIYLNKTENSYHITDLLKKTYCNQFNDLLLNESITPQYCICQLPSILIIFLNYPNDWQETSIMYDNTIILQTQKNSSLYNDTEHKYSLVGTLHPDPSGYISFVKINQEWISINYKEKFSNTCSSILALFYKQLY